jgi:hypothetical protein
MASNDLHTMVSWQEWHPGTPKRHTQIIADRYAQSGKIIPQDTIGKACRQLGLAITAAPHTGKNPLTRDAINWIDRVDDESLESRFRWRASDSRMPVGP